MVDGQKLLDDLNELAKTFMLSAEIPEGESRGHMLVAASMGFLVNVIINVGKDGRELDLLEDVIQESRIQLAEWVKEKVQAQATLTSITGENKCQLN